MANKQLGLSNNRLFNNSNIAAPGGTAELYLSGTTTPANFLDADGDSLGPTLTANGLGQLPTAYQDAGTAFRLILKDRTGAELDGGDIDPFYFGLTGPDADLLQPFADNAAASAASAATSETNAAASASAAATSASNASDSADAAAASEANAAASAEAAATSISEVPNATAHASDRAVLAALSSANGPVYLAEAGREGMFVWNGSNLSTLVTADTQQGIYVAPASDTTGASGAWVRKYSGPICSAWFGQDETGVADSSAAILGAIAVAKALRITGYGYGNGGQRIYTKGIANCGSTTIEWDFPLIFEGDFGCGPSGGGTVFKWTSAVDGLRTNSGAAGSIIRNVFLQGSYTSGAESEAHAIHIKDKTQIRDVFYEKFAGDGIYGSTTVDGSNINDIEISHVFGRYVRKGIYIQGNNANAVRIEHPEMLYCRQYGLHINGTIGEGVITGGDYTSNGTGASGVACYSSYSGFRYGVIPGQETWCSTNAPTGTATSNQGWYYIGAGAADGTDHIAWTSGLTWRAGGHGYIQGGSSYLTIVGGYQELDSMPMVVEGHCTVTNFSTIKTDGTPGPQYFGDNTNSYISRSLKVGDTTSVSPLVSNSNASLSVQGNLYLTRATGNVSDSALYINSTSNYATVQFQLNGVNKSSIYNYNSQLYYTTPTTTGHIFRTSGGTTVLTIAETLLTLAAGVGLKFNATTVIDSNRNATFASVATTTYTVATLPTGSAGMRAFVTDATATTYASAVTGGGTNKVPVFHDGTSWKIG